MYNGKNDKECLDFCSKARDLDDLKANLIVETYEGDKLCNVGDYIAKFNDESFMVYNQNFASIVESLQSISFCKPQEKVTEPNFFKIEFTDIIDDDDDDSCVSEFGAETVMACFNALRSFRKDLIDLSDDDAKKKYPDLYNTVITKMLPKLKAKSFAFSELQKSNEVIVRIQKCENSAGPNELSFFFKM